MRKQFSMLVAATLLVCFTACNNEAPSNNVDGEGSLSISFGFEKPAKAALSAALPNSGWDNIKNMQLLLVGADGYVKVTRTVTVPTVTGLVAPAQIFDRIPAGSYDVYLIANNGAVVSPFFAGASLGTTGVIQAGTKVADVIFKLAASTDYLGTIDGNPYGEASELFIGSAKGTIKADGTASVPITIKRAVSVLRVRIDQTDTTSEANKILFMTSTNNPNASIRLRRSAKALQLTNTAPFSTPQFATDRTKESFVSTKTFRGSEPASGYTGSIGLGADFTLWNDYLILPGGNSAAGIGKEKFNLLISGHAPRDYVGVNGKVSTGSGAGARVWWQADIDGAIESNGILSLNVKIATKGYVDTNPPAVDTYGKISVVATIANWDAVTNVTVPM